MSPDGSGKDVDNAKVVNMVQPLAAVTLQTEKGPVQVDMRRVVQAAEDLGLGYIQKGDVLSIQTYRNAKGQLAPDYESIRIERPAT